VFTDGYVVENTPKPILGLRLFLRRILCANTTLQATVGSISLEFPIFLQMNSKKTWDWMFGLNKF
jgi:hypothetical protein